MAGGRDLVQFLVSTGSVVSTAAKHALVQTPAAPKYAAAAPSIGCPIRSQATTAHWVADGRIGRRPEKCARKRAARDPDTDRRLNSVGIRRPRSFAGMRSGILIPDSVVYRLPPSRRINVFGSNLPAAKPLKSGSPNVLVLSTVSFMVGAALAQRFKIMVLVPAVATVLTVAVGIGATNAYTAWSIVVTAVIAATSMQVGYLIGMSIHGLLAGASSRSAPSTPVRHPAR